MNVLNQLYAGKKVKLKFDNDTDRENFRQSLYKLKKTQDDALQAVDLQEERSQLNCKFEEVPETLEDALGAYCGELEYYATFWLDKKKEISFEIISVEEINPVKDKDDGSNGSEKKVSGSVGEVSIGTRKDSESSSQINYDDEAS